VTEAKTQPNGYGFAAKLGKAAIIAFLAIYLITFVITGVFITFMVVASPVVVAVGEPGLVEVLIARFELVIIGLLIYLWLASWL
jgi:hypothetical protein